MMRMNRAKNGSLIIRLEHPRKNEAVVIGQRTPYSKYNVKHFIRDIDFTIPLGKYDTIEEVLNCVSKIKNRPWYYKKLKEELNID